MKCVDQAKTKVMFKHYSQSTEINNVFWIKPFILFDNNKHPNGIEKVRSWTVKSYLAFDSKVLTSALNQVFNAIMFLYNQILENPLARENISDLHDKKSTSSCYFKHQISQAHY